MLKLIEKLLADVKAAAEMGDRTLVYTACKRIVPEMRRIDARDFLPEVQADFVKIMATLDQWGTDNIRSVDVRTEWMAIEPSVKKMLNAYAGEGSRGDPDFRKKQLAITSLNNSIPPELSVSLSRFLVDHPDTSRSAFIMMQFGKTSVHNEIVATIRTSLASFGLEGLRADDKEYHDDLFANVLTYLHGCSFGIAVFERLEREEFNPNVALEVGYMRALRKPLCLLKDQTLTTLQTDLVGKLYKTFDTQNVASSMPMQIEKWLTDREMCRA